MASVQFDNCLVLSVDMRTSKAGNLWCRLRFLDSDSLNVYDIPCFGDSVAICSGLQKGAAVSLGFDVMPAQDGGVRLIVSSVNTVSSV